MRAASQDRAAEVELLAKVSDVNAKRADNATALTLRFADAMKRLLLFCLQRGQV